MSVQNSLAQPPQVVPPTSNSFFNRENGVIALKVLLVAALIAAFAVASFFTFGAAAVAVSLFFAAPTCSGLATAMALVGTGFGLGICSIGIVPAVAVNFKMFECSKDPKETNTMQTVNFLGATLLATIGATAAATATAVATTFTCGIALIFIAAACEGIKPPDSY